ncbi:MULTISPECIES: hypothetical protein [Acinetobacter calcoaceticus/baumannii complex]|uniref:hypothetical protein n=1 Tax=Acinetobacter calcoaceticus/baumannii complex TaxID=909768 RepID=UPI0006969CB5|nr:MULTISPECIES: hypothetical protein [Acinetobacter calcoaceticus/baumannii complex]MCU4455330.1 hypothetical protein [Acinetobacter pittii]MCU4458808.1 hypothetical protein [Acinetobacter pittii]MDC4563657.1 hypothetical protein [Acinetobacter baumannii]MDC5621366.1 hypothetical protein [Acinetobacter baumannii]MDH2630404.1 hypothetical protein [Acinetobacter baumannii]
MKKFAVITTLSLITLTGCTKKNDIENTQAISEPQIIDTASNLNSDERRKLALLLTMTLSQMGQLSEAKKVEEEYSKIKDPTTADKFLIEKYTTAKSELEQLALTGDYQAQRNIAYSYATDPEKFGRNHIQACGWYLVVLSSGSPKVDAGDKSNVEVYCSHKFLNDSERSQAFAFGKETYGKIYKDTNKFDSFYGTI